MTSNLNISPELEFILSCLRNDTFNSTVFNKLNSELLLDLINDHRVVGAIDNYLKNQATSALAERINAANQQNKLYQLRLIHELDQLSGWFKDIPFTTLKGPVLSQQLFNDPAERTSRDLDILIDAVDLDRAIEMLQSNGYELLTVYETPKQKQTILKHFHHVELFHRTKQIVIELHWNVTTFREVRVDLKDIRSRLIDVYIGDKGYRSLATEDLIGYLSVHGVFHTYFRLQWLYDLKILLDSLTEEELKSHTEYLRSEGLIDFYIITLYLLHVLLDRPMSKTDLTEFEAIPKSKKIVDLCIQQIIRNNSHEQGEQQRGGFLNMIRNHKVQYYAGGIKGLMKNLVSRNVRPENWKIYAFPDRIFGLNQLFSRVISLFGRFKKN